jgi:DNA-binding MarR family transcriptional regulator
MEKKKTIDKPIKQPIGHITGNIHRMFLATINKNLGHIDIERFYYPVLLIESGEGNLSQQELAKKLECDKVQVVRIIDYLSENGYVKRVQNAQDRRKYGLEITEKAKKIIPDIKKAFQKANTLVLSNLPEDKINELYSTLKIIENNLSSYINEKQD